MPQLYASFGVSLERGGVDIRYPDKAAKDAERGIHVDFGNWSTWKRYYGAVPVSGEELRARVIEAAELVGGTADNVLSRMVAGRAEVSIHFSPLAVSPAELVDALASRLLILGVNIEQVFFAGTSLLDRVERRDGAAKEYRINLLLLPDELRLDSHGVVVHADPEKEAKRPPREVAPAEERAAELDRRIADVAKRVEERIKAKKAEEAERMLQEEIEKRRRVEEVAELQRKEIEELKRSIEELKKAVRKKPKKKPTKKAVKKVAKKVAKKPIKRPAKKPIKTKAKKAKSKATAKPKAKVKAKKASVKKKAQPKKVAAKTRAKGKMIK